MSIENAVIADHIGYSGLNKALVEVARNTGILEGEEKGNREGKPVF